MLSMLIGYSPDADGRLVVTRTVDSWTVIADDHETVLGLLDFEAYEAAGRKFRLRLGAEARADGPVGIVHFDSVTGVGSWPEWIRAVGEFAVEIDPGATHPIRRLVHLRSGHVRERTEIEARIAQRIAEADAERPADLRDIVGGPDRPLALDGAGRTIAASARARR